MKKARVILFAGILSLFAIVLFLILNSNSVHAVEISPDAYSQISAQMPSDPDQTVEIGKAYLKQGWTKIMEKYPIGRFFLGISSVLSFFDFFWKPVLGINYSLSWEFIFGIAIFIILYNIFEGLMYAFFDEKWLAVVSGLIIASLVGTTGVIYKGLTLLTFAINNIWIAWISLVIAILIMVVITNLSGGLKAWLEKQKDEEDKRKTKEAEKIIQAHGRVSKKELESYSEGGGI